MSAKKKITLKIRVKSLRMSLIEKKNNIKDDDKNR